MSGAGVPVRSVPVRGIPRHKRVRFVTRAEAAALMGVRVDTVKKMGKRGILPKPTARGPRGVLLWDRGMLEDWIVETGRA